MTPAKIEITKTGRVRRARLHYLRQRQGKEAMSVKEQGQNQSAEAA